MFLSHWVSFIENFVYICKSFLIELFSSWYILLSFLYILDICALLNIELIKYIFPFCILLLCLNDNVLCLTEDLSFMRFHLLIIGRSYCTTSVLFNNLSPMPMYSRLFSTFLSIRISVSRIMLRSLELEFCAGW